MKRSPLYILFITVFIDLLGFGIIFPLLPLYVKQFGGAPVVSGWLATSYNVMQFVFAPLWGRLSDRWGRRPLILLGLSGSAVSFLVYGLATNLPMLFVGRIAGGILTAASLPAAYAYVADVTPPEKRSRGMAMIGMAFGLGFAVGPGIGGWLGKYSLSLPAFVVAGMAAANFVWSYFALPERTHVDLPPEERRAGPLDVGRFARAFRDVSLGELLTVFTVSTFAFSLMEATFTWLVLLRFVEPTHALANLPRALLERRAAATVGPIFLAVGVAILVSQGAVMGGLAQRVGERRLVWLGSLILTVTLLAIGSASSLGVLTVLAVFLAVGEGFLSPSLSSLVSQTARSHQQGGVMGVQQGLGSLARIVAPPLGTWLLQRYSTATPYELAAVLMGLAFLLSLGIRSPERAAANRPPTTV